MSAVQSSSGNDKSPTETFDELKTMLVGYAQQETVGPLKLLGKWVGYGIGGALSLTVGVAFISFGLLRLLQVEVDDFRDLQLSWAPYLIASAFMIIIIGLAFRAAGRSFSEQDSRS